MPVGKTTIEIIQQAFLFALSLWWVYVPIFLLDIFKNMWKKHINKKYLISLEWVLLEIQIPNEEGLGPKAAEQIFAGISGTGSKGNLWKQWVVGKLPDWFSFEIVGIDGEIHFFVRCLKKWQNFMESLIYAQYPAAIIQEVEDYVSRIPKDVPNKNYNLFGSEFILAKDSYYPIRSYPFFEDSFSKNIVDPLSSITEIFTKLKEGEMCGIQILVRAPADGGKEWKTEADKAIAKLIGKKLPPEAKKGWQDIKSRFSFEFKDWGQMLFKAATFRQGVPGTYPEDKSPDNVGTSLMQHLSPDEKEQATAMGIKASKPVLETKVRVMYFARTDVFNPITFFAASGAFRQFNTQNLNGYKLDVDVFTNADYVFPKLRILLKKRELVDRYIKRKIAKTDDVLNIEELATLFHFPDILVKAPMLPRVEAKRAEPPTTLPV